MPKHSTSSQKAVCYLLYWASGLFVGVLLEAALVGPPPGFVWILAVLMGTIVVSGVVYWRLTTAWQRRHDFQQKLRDPNYE